MRFFSPTVNGYTIYAVAGTNSVSFAIDFATADTKGLLGFSVKRNYPDGNFHYVPGFKVFEIDKDKIDAGKPVNTQTEPIQSFVWDDFTLTPETAYTFLFYPVKGKPGSLHHEQPITIKISTEKLHSDSDHDIFFNRGVASSQAYANEFNNVSPNKLVGKKQADAFKWLGRDLPDAIYQFIGQATANDILLGCFYEFDYLPVLNAFKAAMDKGVDVRLIIDAKNNTHTVKGKVIPSSPRDATIKALAHAEIPKRNVIYREANKDAIQHNKFIVLKRDNVTKEVWTGSVNITESGIFGQTNVGHWVKIPEVAKMYEKYWNLLKEDPGAKDSDTAAAKKTAKKNYIKDVVTLSKDVPTQIPKGVTPIFSPRDSLKMLEEYFSLVDKAKSESLITLAFGISADLKKLIKTHTKDDAITFMLLEKPDKPTKKNATTFYALNAANNVYEAYGSYITDPLYRWVAETNATKWGVTKFVTYIHSKFLLQDPLGDDPIVITGSANFSAASTDANDENMVIIRGNFRVADIYFTEFNRLFFHYYFRSTLNELKDKKIKNSKKNFYLSDTDEWLSTYKPGGLHYKRVQMFVNMKNAVLSQ